VRATWIPNGQRQQVMTPGTNRRRTIFGAVDLQSGRFLYQVARKAINATFTAFCEQLLAAYPAAPVVANVIAIGESDRAGPSGRALAGVPSTR
jgi:hypothetical protein